MLKFTCDGCKKEFILNQTTSESTFHYHISGLDVQVLQGNDKKHLCQNCYYWFDNRKKDLIAKAVEKAFDEVLSGGAIQQ